MSASQQNHLANDSLRLSESPASAALSAGDGSRIRVLVSGFLGQMGSLTARTVAAQADLELAAGYDPAASQKAIVIDGQEVAPAFTNLARAIYATRPDLMVDFTLPGAVVTNLAVALDKGLDCVVGTSGLDIPRLQRLVAAAPPDCAVFVAPNFAIGAVLMTAACKLAAPYFADVEIIEMHHNNKADAPSATAIATAAAINELRQQADVHSQAPGAETELDGLAGARGASVGDVRIHALRSDGFLAAQEVIFASSGQTLSIRQNTTDRNAYMPGVLLAIRKVGGLNGLVVGLEELLNL